MERDRLGRRRSPDQERGLRPLHPPLPEEWVSKAVRVAMSEADWDRFEALVNRYAPAALTQARAQGLALSSLLRSASAPQPEVRPMDWMDWERKKALQLLPAPAPQSEPGPLDWMDWERRKAIRLLPVNCA
jgi:hypothetical protein